jgi:hypothetical protein
MIVSAVGWTRERPVAQDMPPDISMLSIVWELMIDVHQGGIEFLSVMPMCALAHC